MLGKAMLGYWCNPIKIKNPLKNPKEAKGILGALKYPYGILKTLITLQKIWFSSILILRDFWRFAGILYVKVKPIKVKKFKIHEGIMKKKDFSRCPLNFYFWLLFTIVFSEATTSD